MAINKKTGSLSLEREWEIFLKYFPFLSKLSSHFGPNGWLPVEVVIRWDCWRFDSRKSEEKFIPAAVCLFNEKTERYRIEIHPSLLKETQDEITSYLSHEIGHILFGHVSPTNSLCEEQLDRDWEKREIEIEAECFSLLVLGEERWKRATLKDKKWVRRVKKKYKKVFRSNAEKLFSG